VVTETCPSQRAVARSEKAGECKGGGRYAPVARRGSATHGLDLVVELAVGLKATFLCAAVQFWPLKSRGEYAIIGACAQPGLKAKPRHPRPRLVLPGRYATSLASPLRPDGSSTTDVPVSLD